MNILLRSCLFVAVFSALASFVQVCLKDLVLPRYSTSSHLRGASATVA